MTDRYAVIGYPISHSKSPWIHTEFARIHGQDLVYNAVEGRPEAFAEDINGLRRSGLKGLNITLPFKEQACSFATNISERARMAGAANALKFEEDAIWAENFDGVGLVRDVQVNLAHPLANQRVLILGAGGATRGLIQPLLAAGPRSVCVANRTADRAHRLQADLGHLGPLTACGWNEWQGTYDVVFNATSASLGGGLPKLAPNTLDMQGLAYDLVYGKGETEFLAWARLTAPEAKRADGLGMLVEQAAEAFAWWRGVRPDTQAVIQTLSRSLPSIGLTTEGTRDMG